MKQTVCILLAGGAGRRTHLARPKQFVEICGRPILSYAVQNVLQCETPQAYGVVCADEWRTYAEQFCPDAAGKHFLGTWCAGETSLASAESGLRALERLGLDGESLVVVHESVRPTCPPAVIDDCVRLCAEHPRSAAVSAWSGQESILVSDDGVHIRSLLERHRAFAAQMPMALRLSDWLAAFDYLHAHPAEAPQSLIHLVSHAACAEILLSRGAPFNRKITTSEDIAMFEALKRG